MLLEQILFFVAAAGAIGGALGVVLLRNPFFSVLALVGHLISLALLFLLLRAEFIAAAQLVVYAGAVMVLYVFVVAYVGGIEEAVGGEGAIGRLGPLFAGALLIELCIAIVGSALPAIDSRGAHVPAGFGSPGAIGKVLLERFLVPFEAASFLLLVAAVGAVVLARRRRGLEDAPDDELPERAGRAPLGDPSGRERADGGDEGPPAGTAEGPGDPTPERDAERPDPVRDPEPQPAGGTA
ncbi:MAG: NADH-quinone oxidoreductase subunit J [Actinobacteria bacterium]|nr:NADH-quinone oxidoreductase subunit J [Actinomycetota bacterium]